MQGNLKAPIYETSKEGFMWFLKNRSRIFAIFYLIFVTAVLYNDSLLPQRTFLPSDLVLLSPPWKYHSHDLSPDFTMAQRQAIDPLYQFYPARKYLAQSLKSGYIPLWNPHAFSGTPFAADDQSAVFYPPNWLFAILPLPMAFGWVAALHTFLAGLFFIMLGRRLGWNWPACLSGATVWMLCGPMVAWQMWQVVHASLCWLPLALYFWISYIRTGKTFYTGGFSASLGLSMLAGHIQFAFYVWMVVFAYCIYTVICKFYVDKKQLSISKYDEIKIPHWKLLGSAIALFVLAGAVSSIQLLTTADFLNRTLRTSSSYKEIINLAMPLSHLLLTITPDIFGGVKDPKSYGYSGFFNYYELACFCGAAAIAFAIVALWHFKSRKENACNIGILPARYFWAGMLIFAVLMGCGAPIYAIFYYGIPLYKSFHGPARILCIFDFSTAILCSIGINRLSFLNKEERNRISIATVIITVLLIALGYRFAVTPSQFISNDLSYLLTHKWLNYGTTQIVISLLSIISVCSFIKFYHNKFSWIAVIIIMAECIYFAFGVNISSSSNLLFPNIAETSFITSHIGSNRVYCMGNGDQRSFFSRIVPNGAMALGWNDVSGSNPLMLSMYKNANNSLETQQTVASPDKYGSIDQILSLLNGLNVKYITSPRPIESSLYHLVYSNLNGFNSGFYVYENSQSTGLLYPSISTLKSNSNLTYNIAELHPGLYQASWNSDQKLPFITSIIADPGWKIAIDNKNDKLNVINNLYIGFDAQRGSHRAILSYEPGAYYLGAYISLISWLFIVIIILKCFKSVKN